jgi:hypothetical protein
MTVVYTTRGRRKRVAALPDFSCGRQLEGGRRLPANGPSPPHLRRVLASRDALLRQSVMLPAVRCARIRRG